jgi:glycosyltransferase involved in cell wall biosynthesis
MTEDQYPHYFDAADAYLHVSLREGFGIPLLESMSSGTPIVALANPPAPEVLGGAACLVPPQTGATEFADSVRSVVESRDAAASLAAAGLERIRKFDPSEVRTSYTEVYLNAMRS